MMRYDVPYQNANHRHIRDTIIMKVGYARESSVGQNLESQIRILEEHGCDKIYQEKKSGRSMKDRDQLQEMLSYVRENDEIVITRTDRIARSVLDLQVLIKQLSDKGVSIMLSDEARNWLAKKGYDKIFGARPLNRLIQEKIKKPLAEELLFGKLIKGGNVFVDNKKDELIIKSESSTKIQDKRNTKIKI